MTGSFGPTSTADEVLEGIDLRGKRALVTGVSSGLGVETARALVAHGASVIGTVRDIEKARPGSRAVNLAAAPSGSIELVELNLASLTSVRACADRLLSEQVRFDLVIANAGVMAPPFGKTEDGFETQFGTNHLGHFVLINRIAPLLNPGARLIIVSSGAHRGSNVNLQDPNFETTSYTPMGAYARSKTANVLFAVEFDRRNRARGIRATSVHPGVIQTQLRRHLTPEVMDQMRAGGGSQVSPKSVQQGAATTIWAATVAPVEAVAGRFCEDCHVAEVDDVAMLHGVRSYAVDPENAKALWATSEEMVGERFGE